MPTLKCSSAINQIQLIFHWLQNMFYKWDKEWKPPSKSSLQLFHALHTIFSLSSSFLFVFSNHFLSILGSLILCFYNIFLPYFLMLLLPFLPNLDSMTLHFNSSPCVFIHCPPLLPSHFSGKTSTLNLCHLHACIWTAACDWRKQVIRLIASH